MFIFETFIFIIGLNVICKVWNLTTESCLIFILAFLSSIISKNYNSKVYFLSAVSKLKNIRLLDIPKMQ